MKSVARALNPWRILRIVFSWLFRVWSEYKRFLLVVFILVALGGFILSLEPATRRVIVAGLFARRSVIVLLLLFSLVTLSLLWSAGQQLDTWVFLRFNLRGYHPLWLDRVMWAATQIGNGAVGILTGIALYFIGQRRLAVQLLLGILTLWLVVELIKAIVERSRPFLVLEGTRIIGWKERGKSFPSGHTAQAFFMMTLLNQSLPFGPAFTVVVYITAVLVGFTRIYVGAHYPRDVIGGAVLGSVWGILTSMVQVYLSTGSF